MNKIHTEHITKEKLGIFLGGLFAIFLGFFLYFFDNNSSPIQEVILVIVGTACLIRLFSTQKTYDLIVVKPFNALVLAFGYTLVALIGLCLLLIFVVVIYFTLPSILALPTNTLLVCVFLYFVFSRK